MSRRIAECIYVPVYDRSGAGGWVCGLVGGWVGEP